MAQTVKSLPAIASGEAGLSRYLQQIRQFPMLEPSEEYMLAKAWKEHGDKEAAHKLITSHLRLVAKLAMGYRGYGLPISEVISEGNVGLMHAVKRFEPDKGFRLATYAMWWIKASIQEFILRSWSLVKMGTTASQKKLFFNLRKVKGQIQASGRRRSQARACEGNRPTARRSGRRRYLHEPEIVGRRIAQLPGPRRLAKANGWTGSSMNPTIRKPRLAKSEESQQRLGMLTSAMDALNDREKRVFEARRLRDEPATLEELSQEFGVSRERIRQIEVRAFEKVQKAVKNAAQKSLLPRATSEATA